MALCKYCGKSGFFLRVNNDGLCQACIPIVVLDVNQRTRIISESFKLINNSKKAATKLSRCDTVIANAEALLVYERKGITTVEPLPSTIIQDMLVEKRDIIVEHAQSEIDKWLAKAEVAATTTTKLTNAGKALLAIENARKELDDDSRMTTEEMSVREYMFDAKLNGFLDEARKAEFKKNIKKAVDRYQEALYLLSTEGQYFGSSRAAQGTEIEAKLAKLQV